MAPSKAVRKQTASSGSRQNESNTSPNKTQGTLANTDVTTTGKLKSTKKTAASKKTIKSIRASPQKTSQSKLDLGSSPTAKGSIQSFFNAAPQRLQLSQDATSRTSRASTPVDLTETIDSDDEHGGVLALSKGSSTALALRKRKSSQLSGAAITADDASLPASQKFRRTATGRVAAITLTNDDKRPWTVQFAPTSLDELAVHKKKVSDVKGWLEHASGQPKHTSTARPNTALILKGPAGSGKTTTLKLLAQSLGIEVLEWSNPSGRDQADARVASAAQFEDFMTRSGRSSGLTLVDDATGLVAQPPASEVAETLQNGRQLLLVEEFPSTFSTASSELQSFRSAIAQHLAIRSTTLAPIPLVMVVSETSLSANTAASDSFTTHRLLGPELSTHPFINTIEFNPIAPTILLKALESIVIKEARKSGRRTTPGPAVLKRLTEFGDIRSAISTLEFLCLRGDDEGNWSARVAFGKTKKKTAEAPPTKLETEALAWISSRESTLGIWHAVGKVLYNKRIDPASAVAAPPSHLSHHHRANVPENDVNVLVNDIGTDTSTFIASLHENYLPSCTYKGSEQTLETACKCLEELSDADLLSLDRFSLSNKAYSGSATDTLRQDEMSFQLAVRGLLFNLPSNVKRSLPTSGPRNDAHRMYYPASLRLWRQQEEIEAALDALKVRLKSQLKSIVRARVDTAYSLANTDATSWSRSKEADAGEEGTALPRESILSLAPRELIMECLPYMADTLQRLSGDSILLDLLQKVVHITGDANVEQSTEDNADDAGDTSIEPLEGAEVRAKIRLSKKTNDTAFATVKPEQQMESLVLEDDDIVDD